MSSAPRVAKHRARMKARAELLTLLLQDPTVRALANELVAGRNELANLLANDPLLLANALQQRELTSYAASRNGSVAPAPQVPPAPPPSPLGGKDQLSLLPTAAMAEPSLRSGRQDESFERMADGFYPAIKGDYSKLDRDSRGLINRSLAQLRAKMDEQGIPLEQRPDLISYGIRNLPNVARGKTPGNLVKHWMAAIAGAERNGRDGGTEVRRYVNQSAVVKHQPKLNLE